jgi:hypothetical protein
MIFRAAILLLSSLSVRLAAADAIREFSIPILERLGNELSHRDEIAARASDLVLERDPDYRSVKPQWWISDLRDDGDVVYFVGGPSSAPAYKVVFGKEAAPVIVDIHGQELPAELAVRLKALQTAIEGVSPKLYDVAYNFEVLNDPEGAGFLVYALAATNKEGEILTGGHFRITVSTDGGKVERIDLLSQLIKQPRRSPQGAETVAVASTQLASKIPVETWLYSSHLYQLPMYVATMDGEVWRAVNGKIEKLDAKLVKEARAKSKAKKKAKKK